MSEAPEVLRFYDDELSRTLEFMTRGGNNKYVRADCIEELELAVRYEADLAQMALDARKELEAKLTKAVDLLEEIEVRLATISGFFPDTFPRKEIKATLAELKGQDDE